MIPAVEGARLIGWTDETGSRADPAKMPVGRNTDYHALTRPLLRSGEAFLYPDENGFLKPNEAFTNAGAAAALRSLLYDSSELSDLISGYDAAPEEALGFDAFRAFLDALFDPAQTGAVLSELPEADGAVTRSGAAYCIVRLLGESTEEPEKNYYPEVSPAHWAYRELCAAALPDVWDPVSVKQQTLDGFLWFDGYLYRLDEEGYFVTDAVVDDLYYDRNGRYTSGDPALDTYVAQTLSGYMEPGLSRRDLLRKAYLHVKNDFNYLVRNYYASGETGWNIPEAITMYETGKGNCYNYAGVFWSLARGLGYNAVTYSGTMGNQNQPHAWTEILLDGEIYICDPEIEMNYWWLAALNGDNSMYTDNFMMLRRNAGNWNYQAVGRN